MAELRNPIGVKLGPTATVDDALRLIDTLDPEREPGRLTFITRMGAGNIRDRLPALVEGVRDAGAQVAWVTDPMHGNTITSSNGYKTRRFEDVLEAAGLVAVGGHPRRGGGLLRGPPGAGDGSRRAAHGADR